MSESAQALRGQFQERAAAPTTLYASPQVRERFSHIIEGMDQRIGRDIIILDPSNPHFPPEFQLSPEVVAHFQQRVTDPEFYSATGTSVTLRKKEGDGYKDVTVGIVTLPQGYFKQDRSSPTALTTSADGAREIPSLSTLTLEAGAAVTLDPKTSKELNQDFVLLHEIGHCQELPEPLLTDAQGKQRVAETWTLGKEVGSDQFATNEWHRLHTESRVTNPDIPRIADAVRDAASIREHDPQETLRLKGDHAGTSFSEHAHTEHATGIFVNPEGGTAPDLDKAQREAAHTSMITAQRTLLHEMGNRFLADPSVLDRYVSDNNPDSKIIVDKLKVRAHNKPPQDVQDTISRFGVVIASTFPQFQDQVARDIVAEGRLKDNPMAQAYVAQSVASREYLTSYRRPEAESPVAAPPVSAAAVRAVPKAPEH